MTTIKQEVKRENLSCTCEFQWVQTCRVSVHVWKKGPEYVNYYSDMVPSLFHFHLRLLLLKWRQIWWPSWCPQTYDNVTLMDFHLPCICWGAWYLRHSGCACECVRACACVCVCVPWKFTSVLNPLVVHRITPSDIQMLGWIQVLSSDIARIISITQFNMICLPNTDFFSSLVGALSPVNHKGLHLGWTQTSLYLQVSRFTSHHTTKSWFFSLFIFRGHSTREPASNKVTYFNLRAYTGTMC